MIFGIMFGEGVCTESRANPRSKLVVANTFYVDLNT